jgi:hypothetical protein
MIEAKVEEATSKTSKGNRDANSPNRGSPSKAQIHGRHRHHYYTMLAHGIDFANSPIPYLTPSKKRRAGSKKRDIDYDHELALSLLPDSSKDVAKSPFKEVMSTLQQVTNQHKA